MAPPRTKAMKKNKLLFLLAAAPMFWGCASFNHGDVLVERSTARAMLSDTTITPFSEINVSWRNFPYRSPTDSIGEGSISNPQRIKPVPVPPEDSADFTRQARETFAKAGLYDKEKGRGALNLEMTSFGRWTYKEILGSFLVDTGFIFIIPSSLRVNYFLAADFPVSTGTARVGTEATTKTTFHVLLAPLYPFTTPGAREHSLLKQMLWRSATDIYLKLKSSGQAARPAPPAAPVPAPEEKPDATRLSGPPLPPDRTWLPGQGPGAPSTPPEAPDKTWVVPTSTGAAPQAIKPETPATNWEIKSATSTEETPDD